MWGKKLKFILACLGLFTISVCTFSQTATVTIYYAGAQARGCCNVCSSDYMCIGSSGCICCDPLQQTKTFQDPVPAGNFVTGITVTYYGADCTAASVPTSINGVLVCSAVDPGTHSCSCSVCNASYCTANFPCGFPGYNYGGPNVLFADPQPAGTEICTQRVVVQINYEPGSPVVIPTPGTITGPSTVCPGQNYSYTIATVSSATSYTWSVPSGSTIISGQGSTSMTMTAGSPSGTVCVTTNNNCGSSVPSCLPVNVGSVPANPGTISGPALYCPGQTGNYSVVNIPGLTYNWTVPSGTTIDSGQGSSSIDVTYGAGAGQISVTAMGPCGISTASAMSINFGALPNPPANITGNTSACTGDVVNYNCAPVAGTVTYNWTVPSGTTILSGQGTAGIAVTTGPVSGSVCVTATTVCGTSLPNCLPVTINPSPFITNTALTQNICVGSATAAVVLASNLTGTVFNWTSSATSGITGNTISGTGNIPSQLLSGSIMSPGTVTYTITPSLNGCSGPDAIYTITVNPVPALTINPLTQTICSGQTVNINLSGNLPGTTFSWTGSCSSGNVSGFSASGTGNITNTLVNNISTTGTIAYVITPELNGCSGPLSIYVVTVNPVPAVTNNPLSASICSGQNFNLSLTGSVAGTTFNWTAANTSGNITGFTASGYGNINQLLTNNQPGAGAVTYTITPAANGCLGTPAHYIVTVNQNAPAGVSIVSNSTGPICAGSQVVFTANTVNGGTNPSFHWQLNGVNAGMNSSTYATTSLIPGNNTVSCYMTSNATTCISNNPAVFHYSISVNPLPNSSINPSGPYCIDTAPVILTAVNNGGTWSGNGITNTANGSFDPAVAGAGTHIISYYYTDPATGCSSWSSQSFIVNALPSVSFSAMNSVCISSSAFALTGGSPAGGIYSGPGVNNTIFTPSSAGIGVHLLTYTFTDPFTGCTNSATQALSVNTSFNITVVPDSISVCTGVSTTLTAAGGTSYTWFPSAGLSSSIGMSVLASPQATTVYTVAGTNADGCTGSTTATVYLYPTVGINFLAAPAMGCSPLSVNFGFAGGPLWSDSSCHWNFGDPDASGNTSVLAYPSYTYEIPGTYDVTLTAGNIYGCLETGTRQIIVKEKPLADFIVYPDDYTTLENPKVAFINNSTNYNSLWWDFDDPGAGNDNYSDQEMPVHFYSDTGTYHITLVAGNSYGCSDKITKPYKIYPPFVLFVPNAFSPDGDGLNDVFVPVLSGIDPENYFFVVYDRWGRKVFESKDPANGWNGLAGGEETGKQDVYTWYIMVLDQLGNKYETFGKVTLLN